MLLVAQLTPPILPIFKDVPIYPGLAYCTSQGTNIITNDDNELIANMFRFGAFADKYSGIVYHDLMRSHLFMSYNGSVCLFVLYHYKSNAILATSLLGWTI
jgi:hypothetical protein